MEFLNKIDIRTYVRMLNIPILLLLIYMMISIYNNYIMYLKNKHMKVELNKKNICINYNIAAINYHNVKQLDKNIGFESMYIRKRLLDAKQELTKYKELVERFKVESLCRKTKSIYFNVDESDVHIKPYLLRYNTIINYINNINTINVIVLKYIIKDKFMDIDEFKKIEWARYFIDKNYMVVKNGAYSVYIDDYNDVLMDIVSLNQIYYSSNSGYIGWSIGADEWLIDVKNALKVLEKNEEKIYKGVIRVVDNQINESKNKIIINIIVFVFLFIMYLLLLASEHRIIKNINRMFNLVESILFIAGKQEIIEAMNIYTYNGYKKAFHIIDLYIRASKEENEELKKAILNSKKHYNTLVFEIRTDLTTIVGYLSVIKDKNIQCNKEDSISLILIRSEKIKEILDSFEQNINKELKNVC